MHIWKGGSAAYVNAIRMGAFTPYLGLVMYGAIANYEIWNVDVTNYSTRGIIALDLPDLLLKPGESYSLEWHVFAHNGNDDFRHKLLEKGSVLVSCNKYVFEKQNKAPCGMSESGTLHKLYRENEWVAPLICKAGRESLFCGSTDGTGW